MAFGYAALPTRKYAFGLREFLPRPPRVGRIPPGSVRVPRQRFAGHDLATHQMLMAHQFQNNLVKLERDRRGAVEAAIETEVPRVQELRLEAEAASERVGELRKQLTAANIAAQAKRSDPQLVAAIREAKTVSAAAWTAYRTFRQAQFTVPAVKEAIAEVDEAFDLAKKECRTQATEEGLYWATSLQVMQRVKKTGFPPKFHIWEGEGTISVQFQRKPDKSSPRVPVLDSRGNPRIHPRSGKPMMRNEGGSSLSVANIFTPNSLFWIERREWHPPLLWTTNEYATVHFRVGSDDDGKPIWVQAPVILHRDFPPDGEVKWAHLSRRRVGTEFRWELLVDIARPEWPEHPAGAERAKKGTVAVALGWRRMDDAIRVAEWVGSDGVRGSVLLPDDLVKQWEYLEGLESVRSRLFDADHAALLEWVSRAGPLPPEWQERIRGLAQWNSPRRLARLVIWWRDHRVPGDEEIFRRLEGELVREEGKRDRYTGGRKQDKHLANWQAHLRSRLRGWRKDFYRQLAIDLSYQYKDVVVAEIDWNEIAENPEVEDDADWVNKRMRGFAACASLRDQLVHYLDEVAVPAAHITVTCSTCAARMPAPGRSRWVTCERCGVGRRDRAENAAENLLKRAQAESTASAIAL